MFNFNLTYSIIILLSVYSTCALNDPNEATLNVGTVLFRPEDMKKKVWSLPDIQLLEARKRLQNILPSPRSVDILSEDYINELIKYFENSFAAVKREATDTLMTDVMEKALADAIAGFFKVWVLPVTKYAYYGGSVSEDDALKVFEFYDNLKSQLNTDGNGWRNPDEGILNSIAISVIPFAQLLHSRRLRDPCEHLAYYEKNNKSLAIPTPYINWGEIPNAMFLPLRNESVILLNSPSSSKALLKYYDIAESCCRLNNANGCDDFNSRFQHWLSNDVVPHLNDDRLYIAFGSVLSLLDKTKQMFSTITDSFGCDYDECSSTSLLPSVHSCMTSKKLLILIAVLLIEIVWCVPTLLYLFFCRKKTKTRKRTQFFLDIFKRRKSPLYKCQTVERIHRSQERRDFINKNSSTSSLRLGQPAMTCDGLKIIHEPRSQIIDIDTQYPSNTSKHSVGQVTESFIDIINNNESVMVINETNLRSSMRKRSLRATNSSHVQTTNSLSNTMNVTSTDQASIATVQKLETTITKIVREQSNDNNSSFKDTSILVGSEIRQNLQEIDDKDEINEVCPCDCCIKEDKRRHELSSINRKSADTRKTETGRKTGTVRKNPNASLERSIRGRNVTDNKKKVVLPKQQIKPGSQKNIKMNDTKGLRLNSGDPLLEIRIDKPAAEITLDINKRSGADKKNAKASKIPRRAGTGGVKEEHGRIKTADHGRTITEEHGRTKTGDHGKIKTEEHGRIKTEEHGRIKTGDHGKINTGNHGRIKIEDHGRIRTAEHGMKNVNAVPNYRRPCVCPDVAPKRETVKKRSADEMDIKKKIAIKRNKMNVTI